MSARVASLKKEHIYIEKVLKEETQKNTKTKSDEMYSKIISTINGQSRQKCTKIVLEFFEIAYIILFFFFFEKILHTIFCCCFQCYEKPPEEDLENQTGGLNKAVLSLPWLRA